MLPIPLTESPFFLFFVGIRIDNLYFYELKHGHKTIGFHELTEKKVEYYND